MAIIRNLHRQHLKHLNHQNLHFISIAITQTFTISIAINRGPSSWGTLLLKRSPSFIDTPFRWHVVLLIRHFRYAFLKLDDTLKFWWHAEILMARQKFDGIPKIRWHAKIRMARQKFGGTPKIRWHAKISLTRGHVGTKARHGTLARWHAGTSKHEGTVARWHAKARWHEGAHDT